MEFFSVPIYLWALAQNKGAPIGAGSYLGAASVGLLRPVGVIANTLWMRAKAAGSKKSEAADDQATDPHHPCERPACQMLRLDHRCCAVSHGVTRCGRSREFHGRNEFQAYFTKIGILNTSFSAAGGYLVLYLISCH